MKINNLPTEHKNYVVARYCDDGWWYWGSYDALDKAYLTAEDVDGQVFHSVEIESNIQTYLI